MYGVEQIPAVLLFFETEIATFPRHDPGGCSERVRSLFLYDHQSHPLFIYNSPTFCSAQIFDYSFVSPGVWTKDIYFRICVYIVLNVFCQHKYVCCAVRTICTHSRNGTCYITSYITRNHPDGRPSHANIQQDTIYISPYACPLWLKAEIFFTPANCVFLAPVIIKTGHGMTSPSLDMLWREKAQSVRTFVVSRLLT